MEPEIVTTKTINMDPVFTRVLTSGALTMLRFFRLSRGPFSTVLTPTFALKDLVCSSFQELQDYRYIIPDVRECSGLLHRFFASFSAMLSNFIIGSSFQNKNSVL